MGLINPESLMPIILEGVRWVRERAGPSKKDLESQMSDLRQQVRFLLATKGESLEYQDYVIRQILKRVQTSVNIVINANTINVLYYESPKHTHMAGPSILGRQEPQVAFFESGQEERLINVPSHAKARLEVVYRHIVTPLHYSRTAKSELNTLFEAIASEELYAVGFYLEDNDHRITEVEIAVDWDKYHQAIAIEGAYFYANLPDWHRGVSPEIHKVTKHLLDVAVAMGKPIYAWFSTIKRSVRSMGRDEKNIYYFEKKVPPWATAPSESRFHNNKLQEIMVIY